MKIAIPSPPPRPEPSERIKVIRELGGGSFGTVSLVEGPGGSPLAMKQICNATRANVKENEIRCWVDLVHKNIVRFVRHAWDRTTLLLFMEFVDGRSLADHYRRSEPIPEVVLGRIAWLSVQALGYLRRKHVLHRDVKPSNILLSKTGDVKVCDFGVGAALEASSEARGTNVGTLKYMSPERLDGTPYSFPADIWGLGLILYEGAAGRYPIDEPGNNAFELRRRLEVDLNFHLDKQRFSSQFIEFLRGCLAIEPERRMTVEAAARSWPAQFRDRGQEDLQAWINSHESGRP
jgi:serine/threonine protein kinase